GTRHLVGDPDPVAGGYFLPADGELKGEDKCERSPPRRSKTSSSEDTRNPQQENARNSRVLCRPDDLAKLCRLLVHGAGCRRRTADRLHRTFDRRPQPADFRRRAAFGIIFARAFTMT